MTPIKKTKDGAWASFDDMAWPLPLTRLGDAEYRLRQGTATRADALLAASVLTAYRQMVSDPKRKRDVVIRRLREAMKEAK